MIGETSVSRYVTNELGQNTSYKTIILILKRKMGKENNKNEGRNFDFFFWQRLQTGSSIW